MSFLYITRTIDQLDFIYTMYLETCLDEALDHLRVLNKDPDFIYRLYRSDKPLHLGCLICPNAELIS